MPSYNIKEAEYEIKRLSENNRKLEVELATYKEKDKLRTEGYNIANKARIEAEAEIERLKEFIKQCFGDSTMVSWKELDILIKAYKLQDILPKK